MSSITLLTKSKPEYLEAKHEISKLMKDCDTCTQGSFSDDEIRSEDNAHLELINDNDSTEEDLELLKEKVRRSRRKLLIPQRAVQVQVSQTSSVASVGNTSESFQDLNEHLSNDLNLTPIINNVSSYTENASELPDGEDILTGPSEKNIFKDLQEETEGEKLDDEILDNVKEEWRAHWGVKCNMCEQVFPYKIEFDKHYQQNYGLVPVYTCTFCNKTTEKYSTFRSHCYRHITEGRYKCQECPKGFSLQSMLHVHVLAKHTKAKPFMCDECGKSFVTKPGLKIHLKKHKTEVKEDYPCVECGKMRACTVSQKLHVLSG